MTFVEKKDYIFTWRLKNYSSCHREKGEKFFSPTFKVGSIPETQWRLFLFPSGDDVVKNGENYISCFLTRADIPEGYNEAISVDFTLEVLNENNSVWKSKTLKNKCFNNENKYWGHSKFLNNDELANPLELWTEDALVLGCRIKIHQLLMTYNFRAEACTEFCVFRSLVEWQVKMPALFKYSENISFSVGSKCRTEITLSSTLNAVEIVVLLKDHKPLPQKMALKITIFDKMGCKLNSKRAVYLFKSSDPWIFPDFITNEILEVCCTETNIYEFELKLEACLPGGISLHSSSSEIFKFASPFKKDSKRILNSVSAIQQGFRNIFTTKKYSDVTIRAGNEGFQAHKFVLRMRSPVFAAMFDQDMQETKTGIVDVNDLDVETLKDFLEFLYTETVQGMDYKRARKLIIAADKYQVSTLVSECASCLKSAMSVENVCDIIATADLINCQSLKLCAMNLIKTNAAQVLSTSAWSQLIEENVKLATCILSKLSATIANEYKLA